MEILQFDDGRHRAGLEAALLAASVERHLNGTVIDLGSGAGAVGMTIAARCPDARIILVDVDRPALACASAALARPVNTRFADRVRVVEADIAGSDADHRSAGLDRASADTVVANPPFHELRRASCSPNRQRMAAHVLGISGLEPWVRCAAALLKPGGQLVFVVAADLLAALLKCVEDGFGAVDVLPVHPRAGLPAARILLRAIKGSRATLRLFPPLVLHGKTGGAYLSGVELVLRGRAVLSDIHAAWGTRS